MSIEIEDQYGGIHLESQKKGMMSYTRDFLLSLSGLELCKKLPSGLDQSILSEIEDAPQDRYRIPGSLSSQNFRRNEYSSSPPTRGDSSTYSRSTPGKWDSRSSNKIDTDSQPDLDSDGRRGSSQPRRPWQVPEHDGLLGSGSFPRPSGYAAGSSAPKFQANAQSQLSRSNEPYQPPRPYKAPTQSRREFTDSLNDETFGSSELTNDDRSEEERKRRASFESMRKEQHKTFQEGVREEFDITSLRDDPKDDKIVIKRNNAPDVLMRQPVSNHDSSKPSLPSMISVSRPLVPPGFSSSMTEKDTGSKTLNNLHKSEVGNELERSLLHAKGNLNLKETSDNQEEKQFLEQLSQRGSLSENVPGNNKSEKIRNFLSASDASSKVIDGESQLYKGSKLSAGFELGENRKALGRDAEEVKVIKVLGEPSPAPSTSILEKLFGNTITLNDGGSSHLIEQHDSSEGDKWNPHTVQSSKFAQWFSEDEKKPSDDLSASRPNDLLSLFSGGEKVRSQVFDVKSNEHALLSSELMSSTLIPDNIQNNELLGNSGKPEVVPAVLTCEDLEQSILSEITEDCSNLPPLTRSRSDHEGNTEKQRENIDGRASQHLLSLLQKGTALEGATESSSLGISSSDKVGTFGAAVNLGPTLLNSKETDAGNVPNSAKPLTLETLFGTAFMKELQGAPSDHRGSVAYGSDSHGPPFNSVNASPSEIASSIPSHGNGLVASNQRQQMKPGRTEEHLFGFDPRTVVDSSLNRTELRSKSGGFDGSGDIRLPEEDSLISVGNSPNFPNFMPVQNFAREELSSNPGRPLDIPGKLSGLNHAFREERPIVGQEGPTFSHGSYNMRDPDVHFNLHAQSSSPQLHPSQLNQAMFHPLDSHPGNINAQMKLMTPENIIHRDSPPNHHFPANMLRPPFHHPSAAPTGFDHIAHNPLLQPMHAPGNFPRQHLLRGLPRGPPFPQHPNNQVSGFMQEPNSVQGFPFGQRQPNYGGTGIPPQAPDAVGGVNNHPGELQRLMEMELRLNPKQVHPFPAAGHGPGMYGHELDMGFGFR